MKKFNIYYGYNKINKKPLKEEDVRNIMSNKYIYKMIDDNNVRISTSDIKIIKCTIL
jgi:hypothetical protein